MDKEIKGKWIDALRSGKYKQGTKILRRNDEYCCLGVLCDIVDPEGWTPLLGFLDEGKYIHHGALEHPDDTVVKVTGLKDRIGSLEKVVGCSANLISLNDNAGYTFEQIADIIEEQF
jgi:hypothetical protein